MVHAISVINHSNGRTLFRKHNRRRRRPSSPFKALKNTPKLSGSSLHFTHLHTFIGDMFYASKSVAWFLLFNWIELLLWACVGLLCGLGPLAGMITEVVVLSIELLCSALAGRGSLLFFIMLLSLGDMSGASVWACLWQNLITVGAVTDYIESGKLRRDLYRRTKLCIFKYNFICCYMNNDDSEGAGIRVESGSKRRKVTKASLGNLPMCRRRKGESVADVPPPFSMKSSEVQILVGQALRACTCRKEEGAEGCLYRNCDGSLELMASIVKDCRATFAHLDDEEKCSRQTELLRNLLPPVDTICCQRCS